MPPVANEVHPAYHCGTDGIARHMKLNCEGKRMRQPLHQQTVGREADIIMPYSEDAGLANSHMAMCIPILRHSPSSSRAMDGDNVKQNSRVSGA